MTFVKNQSSDLLFENNPLENIKLNCSLSLINSLQIIAFFSNCGSKRYPEHPATKRAKKITSPKYSNHKSSLPQKFSSSSRQAQPPLMKVTKPWLPNNVRQTSSLSVNFLSFKRTATEPEMKVTKPLSFNNLRQT